MNEWENCCRINTLLLLLSMLNQKVENCLIRSKGIAFCKNRQYYHAKKFSAAAASFKETISEWMEINSVLFDLMTLLRSEVDSLVLEEVVAQSSNSRFFSPPRTEPHFFIHNFAWQKLVFFIFIWDDTRARPCRRIIPSNGLVGKRLHVRRNGELLVSRNEIKVWIVQVVLSTCSVMT